MQVEQFVTCVGNYKLNWFWISINSSKLDELILSTKSDPLVLTFCHHSIFYLLLLAILLKLIKVIAIQS